MYPHAHTRRHVSRQILRSKRTLGWRTVLIVPELLHEVDQLEQGSDSRFAASQLRMERATIDTQLRRNQLQRLQLLQSADAEGVADGAALAELDALEESLVAQQRALSERLATELRASHSGFHSQWGQLFKAGHQNSRWAQQVQDYACLYTSHATNLLFATGNTTFRALSDLMPHDRAVGDDGLCSDDVH